MSEPYKATRPSMTKAHRKAISKARTGQPHPNTPHTNTQVTKDKMAAAKRGVTLEDYLAQKKAILRHYKLESTKPLPVEVFSKNGKPKNGRPMTPQTAFAKRFADTYGYSVRSFENVLKKWTGA